MSLLVIKLDYKNVRTIFLEQKLENNTLKWQRQVVWDEDNECKHNIDFQWVRTDIQKWFNEGSKTRPFRYGQKIDSHPQLSKEQ